MKYLMSALVVCSLVLVLAALGCGGDDDGDGTDVDVVEQLDCDGEALYQAGSLCVECTANEHCPEAQSCSADANQCVCPEAIPQFDGEVCRGCLNDGHCGEGEGCDLNEFACAAADCGGDTPYLFAGNCVECTDDEQCKGELECNAHAHICQCPDPKSKVVDGECVECTKSSECSPGYICDKDTGMCKAYASSCPADKPLFLGGECVECVEDSDCDGAGETCHLDKHTCMPPPLECPEDLPYEHMGKCVQCLATFHCVEGKLCKEVTKTCEDPVSTGECIPNGNGKKVGFQIGDFQVVDCDGTPVSLHENCGTQKAVWLITVAGWCGACDGYAPEANQTWLKYKEQGLQLYFVLGEDPNSGKPTPGYCKQWAIDHSVTAPVLIDQSWVTMDTKISASGNELPWDFLLDGDDMTFVWESVQFSPGELENQIKKLLND